MIEPDLTKPPMTTEYDAREGPPRDDDDEDEIASEIEKMHLQGQQRMEDALFSFWKLGR